MLVLRAGIALIMLTSSLAEIHTTPGGASPDTSVRTFEISASSSIGGRPMANSRDFRKRLASAMKKVFPSAKLVRSGGDVFIIFTIVDYVPGCMPEICAASGFRFVAQSFASLSSQP